MSRIDSDATLSATFDDRVKRLRYPAFVAAGGRLTPFDLSALPLDVARVFVVQAIDGSVRGGHAHRTGRQLLVRLAGEIEVELRWRGVDHHLVLDATDNALLIAAPVWSRQRYRGAAASLLVFCDSPYDPQSYIYEKA